MFKFDLSNGNFPSVPGTYASNLGLPIVNGTDVILPLVYDPEGDSGNSLFPVHVGF